MKRKKMYSIFSTFVVLSLAITACQFIFGNGNNAAEPDNYISRGDNNNGDSNDEYSPAATEAVEWEPAAEEPDYGAPAEMESVEAGGDTGEEDRADYYAPMPTTAGASPPIAYPTPLPTYATPSTTFFEDYGVNPFIDTEDDHLSTFAMDVDTASYTIARNYINNGIIVPADAVRVEEFVNYFPQGYPIPSARDVFGIYIDGAPTPFGETDRYQTIRIGVQGYDIDISDRKDVSLTFVIDVSGSMSYENRLEIVKEALAILVDQLRSSDRVGIIAYSDTAWVVLKPTSGSHKEKILEAIYSLYPIASTNAEAGLKLGYKQASEAYMPGGVNRVVLCSDGVANVGETGPDSIWESIKYYAAEGITLTAVGVGIANYNDVLLEQLADNGDGFYVYIDTLEEAKRVFSKDIVSTLQVIALDAKIQVDFNPEVVARYRLIGFENRAIADEDFRDDKVDAAEIGAGHSVTALYEIKLHPGASGKIATVYIRWQDPDTFKMREGHETFYTREMEDSFRLANPYFQFSVLVAEFAEILRGSYWAEDSSLSFLLEYAEPLGRIVETPEAIDFVELLRKAVWLYGE